MVPVILTINLAKVKLVQTGRAGLGWKQQVIDHDMGPELRHLLGMVKMP